jgi:hypothetical protein
MLHLLLCLAAFLGAASAGAQPQAISLAPCNVACDSCLRVTEPILVDPSDTWGKGKQLKGAEADTLLYFLEVTDSLGAAAGAKIWQIRTCSITESLLLATYHVRGSAGGTDESIYAVIVANGTPISHTCIGILRADCASTYVRGCVVEPDGSLRIAELQHNFDCENDALVSTEHFDDTIMRLRADGTFEAVR